MTRFSAKRFFSQFGEFEGRPVVVRFDREASQTRGYCVAKNATHRAARPDSLGFARDRLFTAQRTLVQDDNQSAPFPSWRGSIGKRAKRAVIVSQRTRHNRAARPDPSASLGTGSSLRKERLFRMTIKLLLYGTFRQRIPEECLPAFVIARSAAQICAPGKEPGSEFRVGPACPSRHLIPPGMALRDLAK